MIPDKYGPPASLPESCLSATCSESLTATLFALF
jgi:hypothetical protein